MQKSLRGPLIVLLIVAGGAALRLYGLGKAAPWLDETITYDRALANVTDIIKASYGWDMHPPTYYIITHYMIRFGHSPEVLRFFSVICGVIAIPVFYALGREILGKREALVAVLLFAVSAFQIRYSQEARMYALFSLLSLPALLFFYRGIVRQRQRDWFLWAGFSVAYFYVHYFSLFLITAQLAFYLLHLIRTKTYRQFFKQQRPFLLAALVLVVGCLPAVPMLVQQITGKISSYKIELPTTTPLTFLLVFLKVNFYPNTLAQPLVDRGLKYIIGAFIFLGALLAWKRRKDDMVFLGILIVVPLALAWVASHIIFFSLTFRYLLFLNAPLVLLLAISTTAIADKMAAVKTGKALALAAVLGVIGLAQFYILANYYQNPRSADWHAGFAVIKQNCRESDMIVPIPSFATYIAHYYLINDESRRRVLWLDDTSPPELEKYINQHDGVFFVVTEDLYPPEYRQTVDSWLARHGRVIWEDPNFPGNVIWYAGKKLSLGIKNLENGAN